MTPFSFEAVGVARGVTSRWRDAFPLRRSEPFKAVGVVEASGGTRARCPLVDAVHVVRHLCDAEWHPFDVKRHLPDAEWHLFGAETHALLTTRSSPLCRPLL